MYVCVCPTCCWPPVPYLYVWKYTCILLILVLLYTGASKRSSLSKNQQINESLITLRSIWCAPQALIYMI